MPVPTPQENAGRSGVYRLLGRLWLQEVDTLLLNQLGRGDLGAAFENAGGVVPTLVTGETVEDLAVDFCQLFLGPSQHCPPYQSVWETGQFEGEAGNSMLGFAEVVRYDPSAVLPGGMLDHLGLQLDLMGHLLGGSIAGETQIVEEVANAFYSAHLSWPEPLLVAAQERARTAFYRSLLKLTGEFLETEARS